MAIDHKSVAAYDTNTLFPLYLYPDPKKDTLPPGCVKLGWKRVPRHYRLFALAMIAFVLSIPAYYINPLYSQPRFLMIIFPIFVILAIWGKARLFHWCYITASVILFSYNVYLFVSNYWIV